MKLLLLLLFVSVSAPERIAVSKLGHKNSLMKARWGRRQGGGTPLIRFPLRFPP